MLKSTSTIKLNKMPWGVQKNLRISRGTVNRHTFYFDLKYDHHKSVTSGLMDRHRTKLSLFVTLLNAGEIKNQLFSQV